MIANSSGHYEWLTHIADARTKPTRRPTSKMLGAFTRASNLVIDAYYEMLRRGDASYSDPYSADDFAAAVCLVMKWEKPE